MIYKINLHFIIGIILFITCEENVNEFRSGLSIIELFYLFKLIFEKQKTNKAGPHQVDCVNCICFHGFTWVWFLSTNQVIYVNHHLAVTSL